MINHKKIYCNYFGYDVGDTIKCEVCLYDLHLPFSEKTKVRVAVDIHHIIPRSKGGSNRIRGSKYPLDYPENLMALCREHHLQAELSKDFNKRCKIIHLKNIIKKIEDEQIKKYKW